MHMKTLVVQEVAERLRVHPETARKYVREGKLPMIKVGLGRTSKLTISEEKFNRFLERYHYSLHEVL